MYCHDLPTCVVHFIVTFTVVTFLLEVINWLLPRSKPTRAETEPESESESEPEPEPEAEAESSLKRRFRRTPAPEREKLPKRRIRARPKAEPKAEPEPEPEPRARPIHRYSPMPKDYGKNVQRGFRHMTLRYDDNGAGASEEKEKEITPPPLDEVDASRPLFYDCFRILFMQNARDLGYTDFNTTPDQHGLFRQVLSRWWNDIGFTVDNLLLFPRPDSPPPSIPSHLVPLLRGGKISAVIFLSSSDLTPQCLNWLAWNPHLFVVWEGQFGCEDDDMFSSVFGSKYRLVVWSKRDRIYWHEAALEPL